MVPWQKQRDFALAAISETVFHKLRMAVAVEYGLTYH